MTQQYQPQNDLNPRSGNASGTPPNNLPNNQLYGQQPPNVQPQQPLQQSPPQNQQPAQLVPPPPEKKPSVMVAFRGLFGTIQLVVGAILLAFIINTFVFQSYQVVGDSMNTTLHDGDRLIINKLGKSWTNLFGGTHTPKRGDIIVFSSPVGDKQLVKRVIGLPGDRVVLRNGVFTIYNEQKPSGFNPDSPYQDTLTKDVQYSLETTVTDGNLFVAGDNRVGGASLDSRNDLGLVSLDTVVGELVMRLLPLSDSRLF